MLTAHGSPNRVCISPLLPYLCILCRAIFARQSLVILAMHYLGLLGATSDDQSQKILMVHKASGLFGATDNQSPRILRIQKSPVAHWDYQELLQATKVQKSLESRRLLGPLGATRGYFRHPNPEILTMHRASGTT